MKARSAKVHARPHAVLVLGMHRSGTSATAGALGLLGLTLGERLLEAAPDNPKGYFEHADAVWINDGLLDGLDRSWNDIRALPRGWAGGKAARAAEKSIAEHVIGRFPRRETWAIKDPRLCRLLPPWLRALSRQKLRAACVLVLRHPDEVADSLALRDFMPHTASYILWLRHVLESVQGSAQLPRALLRYDKLLATPGATLRAAGRQIGFDWPLSTKLLKTFVSSDDRHHRAPVAGSPGSEWHALALDVYGALCGRDPWADVKPLIRVFEDMADRHSSLIESLGSTLKGVHVANQAWSARSVEAQAHAEDLQRGLDHVTELSLQRLEALETLGQQTDATQQALQRAEHDGLGARAELEQMGRQLADTQEAQHLAEMLSLDRLGQMATLDEHLSASELARTEIEKTAVGRMAEVELLGAQLAETQAALADAGQLAVARLEQLSATDKELRALAKAKTDIEKIAVSRMAEAELLGAQLFKTQQALATAEQMSLERLGHLESTDKQLQAYATAQTAIESLAINRLEEIENMGLQLAQTQEALANATDLSISRLAEINKQAAALLDARARIESFKTELEDRDAELSQMQALLDKSVAGNLGLTEALQQARASLQTSERTVASQQWELQAAEAAAAAYREEIDANTKRLHAVEMSLDAIWSSWRWRLAHPVQWHRKRREPVQ